MYIVHICVLVFISLFGSVLVYHRHTNSNICPIKLSNNLKKKCLTQYISLEILKQHHRERELDFALILVETAAANLS